MARIARAPRPNKPQPADHAATLAFAIAKYENDVAIANASLHARARAAWAAHRAGWGWARLAAALGCNKSSAAELVHRYENAISAGRTLCFPGTNKEHR